MHIKRIKGAPNRKVRPSVCLPAPFIPETSEQFSVEFDIENLYQMLRVKFNFGSCTLHAAQAMFLEMAPRTIYLHRPGSVQNYALPAGSNSSS